MKIALLLLLLSGCATPDPDHATPLYDQLEFLNPLYQP